MGEAPYPGEAHPGCKQVPSSRFEGHGRKASRSALARAGFVRASCRLERLLHRSHYERA